MKMFPILALSLGLAAVVQAQAPDLARFGDPAVWRLHNRAAAAVPDRAGGLRLDARDGDGVAWLVGSDFRDGTIECDLRGQDLPGRSFVGLAFRGADDSTYDAVYFRAFNFRNAEVSRRSRAVQYISHPEFTWQKLRETHPGKYEATVAPVPAPDDWFRVRLVVSGRTVKAFVNDASVPCLTVETLRDRAGGAVGLWVGFGSAGDFANLRINPR